MEEHRVEEMPRTETPEEVALREKIEAILSQIRPAINADGGDVELVEVSGRSAKIRMVGACVGCPSSLMTLQLGIERLLKEEIPEFEELIPVSPFEDFGPRGFNY